MCVCRSGRGGGVLHLLGAVPRAAADRHIRVQPCVVRQRGQGGLTVPTPAVRHLHVRVRRALLRVHHHQSDTVSHHVAEIPGCVQGTCTPAVRRSTE